MAAIGCSAAQDIDGEAAERSTAGLKRVVVLGWRGLWPSGLPKNDGNGEQSWPRSGVRALMAAIGCSAAQDIDGEAAGDDSGSACRCL